MWEAYTDNLKEWKRKRNERVGAFSESLVEQFWVQSQQVPRSLEIKFPVLRLPLRLHLAQGSELGCSLSEKDCVETVVADLNRYWSTADIEWVLVDTNFIAWSNEELLSNPMLARDNCIPTPLQGLQKSIWALCRDPETGMMTNKEYRRHLFLDCLLPNHRTQINTFDIYFFDFIGHESQGCCISRETGTIVMGTRSSKGYDVPTTRPLNCLTKTCAHELGHALGLDHPKGRTFSDGRSQTEVHGLDNLMVGGIDSKGGGGCKLEEYQILIARYHAEIFLRRLSQTV